MVVGTSAAVAIALSEPGNEERAVHLENPVPRLMPAAIRAELGIVPEARLWLAGQDVVGRLTSQEAAFHLCDAVRSQGYLLDG